MACIMSDKATKDEKDAGAKASGPGMMSMMLAAVAAGVIAVAGCGGVVLWLAKSGRLGLPSGVPKVEAATIAEPAKTHLVALDPLLVNLADEGGHGYLRVGLSLRVEDKPPVKGAKAEEPAKGKPVNEFEADERDAALSVMGRETATELLAPEGKESLKLALHKALTQRVPEVKVTEVLFTEFLVQR